MADQGTPRPHPLPLALYVKDDVSHGYVLHAYRCGACPRMFSLAGYGGAPGAATAAHQCCAPMLPCKKCSRDVTRHAAHGLCDPCWRAWQDERDRLMFEKAAKVPEAEYDGPVFDARTDAYYPCVDFLRDHYQCDGDELPVFCWAAERYDLSLDASTVLQGALEEAHEDAWEQVDHDGLQKALDAWVVAQNCHWYHPDTDKAVILTPEASDGTV